MKNRISQILFNSGAFFLWRQGACIADQTFKRMKLFSFAQRGCPIFMFHRIDVSSPAKYGASVEEFEDFCQLMAESYEVVSLPELDARRRQTSNNSRVAAITFDDGYRDTYEQAWPILRRYGLTATLFLVNGSVGKEGAPLWTERLRYMIDNPGREPTCDRFLGVPLKLKTSKERDTTRSWLSLRLKEMTHQHRQENLDELQALLGIEDLSPLRASMLDWSQVKEMRDQGLHIGCHTSRHSILSRETATMLRQEINEAKEELEGRLGEKVSSFAYPNGQPKDINQDVIACVKQAGFKLSCTTSLRTCNAADDPFLLPRLTTYQLARPQLAVLLEQSFYRKRELPGCEVLLQRENDFK